MMSKAGEKFLLNKAVQMRVRLSIEENLRLFRSFVDDIDVHFGNDIVFLRRFRAVANAIVVSIAITGERAS